MPWGGIATRTFNKARAMAGLGYEVHGSRSASGIYNQRPTVLFVGAIVENKGAKVLIEAVLRLRRKYPDIRLQMIGKGDPT